MSEHPQHEHTHPLDIDYEPVGNGRRGKMWLILVILLSVALAATAQLTLKYGVDQVKKEPGSEKSGIILSEPVESAIRVAKEPFIWGGLILFGASAALWIIVLSRVSLSFAYPFAALTYAIILVFDRIVLKESVPSLRWLGVLFIMGGIILVSRTHPS